jgi:DNA mismatch repair protein MutL
MGVPLSEAPIVAGRIHILPPELAEQIAAGEVVERPSSVVKELVENSLDAGAKKIEVALESGGRRLLRVVDDGCGMTPDEARLALRRHATSKLRAAEELWGLRTFGFRGEALPSIAAVSRLHLSTKTADSVAGFRLSLEAGREVEARETGMPDGTQIEVGDLFFNTPVRLKFLKAEATETGNVTDSLLRQALSHPGVHFRLRSDDRTLLDLPPVPQLVERVRSALGRRGTGVLHEALGEENGVRVQAFVAAPEEAASTPRNTFLYVNRRSVRDRSLLAALGLAYGELLERGRYPLGVLFVDLTGEDVDVNVHPQKLEVRFARPQEVAAAVRHIVGAAIARAPWLSTSARAYQIPAGAPEGAAETASDGLAAAPPWSMEQAAARAAAGSRMFADTAWRAAPAPRFDNHLPPPAIGATEAVDNRPASPPVLPEFFTGLTYIGQLHRTYLVCEAPGEMVLLDQHAAHERLTFQRLRRAHQARTVARQRLLFPVELDLDDAAQASIDSDAAKDLLDRLGFDIEGWGSRRLVLSAVPELLKDADPQPLLLDALHGLGEGPHFSAAEEAVDHLLATLACHGSRRAGDAMTREEAEALLAALDASDFRSHCPHGRPVLVRFSISELERRFGRT